jgi:hypothetical protein
MKNFIASFALVTLITAPAFAATVKKITTTTTSSPAVVSEPAVHNYSHSNDLLWGASFGLGTVDGKFYFGLGLKAQMPFTIDNNDFKFGMRSGFYLGPSSPTTWIIPILATSEYDLRVNNAIKPYLGVELGLSIDHISAGGAFGTGVSDTSTHFAFLFVPGVHFGDRDAYFFELPLGTISSAFVLLPSIGMHF